jgi:hypothetical protein
MLEGRAATHHLLYLDHGYLLPHESGALIARSRTGVQQLLVAAGSLVPADRRTGGYLYTPKARWYSSASQPLRPLPGPMPT